MISLSEPSGNHHLFQSLHLLYHIAASCILARPSIEEAISKTVVGFEPATGREAAIFRLAIT